MTRYWQAAPKSLITRHATSAETLMMMLLEALVTLISLPEFMLANPGDE